ncbi:hypothetical protein DRQ33_04005, partial [bacterium]
MSVDKVRPFVFAISGLDPSGKAGLLKDISVINRLSAIAGGIPSAITVQDFHRGYEFQPIDSKLLSRTLRTIWADRKPDAVKIGMIPDINTAEIIAENIFYDAGNITIIWDPVMTSSDGLELVNPDQYDKIFSILMAGID